MRGGEGVEGERVEDEGGREGVERGRVDTKEFLGVRKKNTEYIQREENRILVGDLNPESRIALLYPAELQLVHSRIAANTCTSFM